MRLTCNKCHHHWEGDEDSAALPVVQCPECYAVVPIVLAKGGDASAASSPTVASPMQAPPPAAPGSEPPRPEHHAPIAPRPSRKAAPAPQRDTVAQSPPARPAATSDTVHGQATVQNLPPRPAAATATDTPTTDPFSRTITPGLVDTDPFGKTMPTPPPGPQSISSASTEVGSFDRTVPSVAPEAAPTRGKSEFSGALPKDVDLTGRTVGGYEIKKMLGAGGMGAVALARQVSLDRDVALKILPGALAANPEFLVRFTREALSAAQMSHHNIIQVHDVGSDGDVHFISMEFVPGDNLGSVVRREGRMTADEAGGYVLQAARGLKYAHERGVIHRDIKPDNIMVNDHGIVKLADMGLAKIRGELEATQMPGGSERDALLKRARGDLTLANAAMGTPAYMAPEQARDASSVDDKADQYSLGCTLYYLVAGEPPFSGSTAFEIMSKHMSEPLPPLEGKALKLPPAFGSIVQRMTEKEPSERFASMKEVVESLEAALGVEGEKGAFGPREHHAEILDQCQKTFYNAPAMKLRRFARLGFAAVVAVGFVMSVLSAKFIMAGAFLGLGIITPLASFAADGILHKSYLFRRVRSVVLGMTIKGWASAVFGVVLGLLVLFMLGLLLPWIAVTVVAVGLAVAYEMRVRRPLSAQREEPLTRVREMLKSLRIKGVSEESLHDFVARFTGDDWEEFFEELFGYEAMIIARGKWASVDRVKPRRKFGIWREPVVRWLEQTEEARKTAKDKKQLASVEAKRLKAQGMGSKEAEAQAATAATAIYADIQTQMVTLEEKVTKQNKKRLRDGRSPGMVNAAFRAVRFLGGLFILALFSNNYFRNFIPEALRGILGLVDSVPMPDELGLVAKSFYGAAAGVLLLISAFSARVFGPLLVLLGALLVLGMNMVPGLSGNSMVTPAIVMLTGAGLAVGGLAMCVLGRMSGGRF